MPAHGPDGERARCAACTSCTTRRTPPGTSAFPIGEILRYPAGSPYTRCIETGQPVLEHGAHRGLGAGSWPRPGGASRSAACCPTCPCWCIPAVSKGTVLGLVLLLPRGGHPPVRPLRHGNGHGVRHPVRGVLRPRHPVQPGARHRADPAAGHAAHRAHLPVLGRGQAPVPAGQRARRGRRRLVRVDQAARRAGRPGHRRRRRARGAGRGHHGPAAHRHPDPRHARAAARRVAAAARRAHADHRRARAALRDLRVRGLRRASPARSSSPWPATCRRCSCTRTAATSTWRSPRRRRSASATAWWRRKVITVEDGSPLRAVHRRPGRVAGPGHLRGPRPAAGRVRRGRAGAGPRGPLQDLAGRRLLRRQARRHRGAHRQAAAHPGGPPDLLPARARAVRRAARAVDDPRPAQALGPRGPDRQQRAAGLRAGHQRDQVRQRRGRCCGSSWSPTRLVCEVHDSSPRCPACCRSTRTRRTAAACTSCRRSPPAGARGAPPPARSSGASRRVPAEVTEALQRRGPRSPPRSTSRSRYRCPDERQPRARSGSVFRSSRTGACFTVDRSYSTVTLLARLRGLSMSRPSLAAAW